jgi:hypothetical protein
VGFWEDVLHGRFPIDGPDALTVVYGIADKAFYWDWDEDLGGQFWVRDYREFLNTAASPLAVRPCDQAN